MSILNLGYITNDPRIHICGYDKDHVLYQVDAGPQLVTGIYVWYGEVGFWHDNVKVTIVK